MKIIEKNRRNTMINRVLIIILSFNVLFLIANAFVVNHTLADCETRLFEKLTNKKAPTVEDLK